MYRNSIIDRLFMVFDGWACKYEEMPEWRPRISIEKKSIFIGDHFFCHTDSRILGVLLDGGVFIRVLYENADGKTKEATIVIEWPYGADPFIEEIEIADNPDGRFDMDLV